MYESDDKMVSHPSHYQSETGLEVIDVIEAYGIIFIVLGALTIPIEWDATFFLFTLMLGILLFVSRENCIID